MSPAVERGLAAFGHAGGTRLRAFDAFKALTLDLADPNCAAPHGTTEAPPPSCGLGPGLMGVLLPLLWLRRRRAIMR